MLEREVKLGAGPGFHLPPLHDLEEGAVAAPAEMLRLETIYYDTPDMRLVRWGCSLRHRRGEGWTIKLPNTSHGEIMERPELNFEGAPGRPPASAVDLLRAYIRRSEVVPVARLSTRRHRVRILGPGGGRLAEVVDDEVTVLDGRRVAGRFRELEVELGLGSEALLGELLRRLREAGAGVPETTSKLVRALGPPALQAPEVAAAPLGDNPSAGDVVRRAIVSSVALLLAHDPLVRVGGHIEDVHQARVATRRLRSDLRLFSGLLDPHRTENLRFELKWLAAELGAVRDAEVLQDRLRGRSDQLARVDHPALSRLARRLGEAVEQRRAELLIALGTPRYLDLIEELVEAADRPPLRESAGAAAREVLPSVIVKPWRSLRQAARKLGPASPDDDLHEIRILAKRVRYAAEAAAPVMGLPAKALARGAARLQTVLGEHQDAITAQSWLRGMGSASRQSFLAGQLWALEAVAAREAREEWPAAWAALDRKKLTAWIG